MKFTIKASLNSHSVEFVVVANSLGEALRAGEAEFRKIYCTANDFDQSNPITTWGERKISAKEKP